MDQDNNVMAQDTSASAEQAQTVPPQAEAAAATNTTDEVGDHKLFAILGYILPFLFFVPMINDESKNNAFARFHANQQLTLLVIWAGLYIFSQMFYMVMAMGVYMIIPLINLALLVLVILGIINAAQGKMKELPVVGKFNMLNKLFK